MLHRICGSVLPLCQDDFTHVIVVMSEILQRKQPHLQMNPDKSSIIPYNGAIILKNALQIKKKYLKTGCIEKYIKKTIKFRVIYY